MNFLTHIFNQVFKGPTQVAPTGQQAVRSSFPPTFGTPLGVGETEEELLFDPSTQHYARAFRRGDPKLPPGQLQRWQAARRQVMQHLLGLSVEGPRMRQLVLRGSLTMKAWAGEAAREPGDIDWVVVPESVRMNQSAAFQIIDGIIQAVSAHPRCEVAQIEAADITQTDIWTYDRAPGRRVAFPWRCADLPAAVVQMDFVFEQKLHAPAQEMEIDMTGHDAVSVMAASVEESLAWKLLWLRSDIHPQGKDLYDAVLLAERSILTAELLKQVFGGDQCSKLLGSAKGFPFEVHATANVDWENFIKECPWVTGTAHEWMARLAESLRPTVLDLRK